MCLSHKKVLDSDSLWILHFKAGVLHIFLEFYLQKLLKFIFVICLQCYDKYLEQSLRKAAKLRGHSFWARGPDNAGEYNSRPHETGFFCERGDYDSYYGRFFLHWYAQSLIDHADNVLSLANLAFEETEMVVKVRLLVMTFPPLN